MFKTIIVLPDGTELSSGVNAENAIISVTITESVNDSQELTIGSACANKLEASIRVPSGEIQISAGQEVEVYKVDVDGNRHPFGLFTLEKPVWSSAETISITAYDRIAWLDKDLSEWVSGLVEWPMELLAFAKEVCAACGLTLINDDIPNGSRLVQAFTGSGITGRQLIRWVGQAAGRFARATIDGNIIFDWYAPAVKEVTPDGELFYYQNSLSYSDYSTAPIEKVQIQLTENDIGTVWPNVADDVNAYKVTGNYLLTAEESEELVGVAQNLFSILEPVSYTPCKITCPLDLDVKAGNILQITDRKGKTFLAYVMTRTITGQRMTLESFGSYRRDSVSAVNETGFRALNGKVLELQMGVEGIKVENKDTAGHVATLLLDVEGLQSTVSEQGTEIDNAKTSITEIKQAAEGISFEVSKIKEEGVDKVKTGKGYLFDDTGLHITDHQSDIKNTLDNTGMYVKRGEEIMLQANKDGVVATDVTVNNYLVIGHARFEEYNDGTGPNRTACFYV